ncbi:MAG TPA: L,D-transpeptidase family protein [Desulfomonilaceae bacterium]|nr:L,D-transpeptidase family protein [Desulfomonilaceae bacterium]
MLAIIRKRPPTPLSCVRAKKIAGFVLFLALAWSTAAHASEPLYPVALMNWMVEGCFHALIVDKSQQRLFVWRIKDGEPSLVESYRCSTGENDGDKWVRGDMRTPEGVYFFCSVIDGRTLPSKYGYWAFTTDYPNFVDRRRGKNGDGIWLHGRDKPLAGKPDSNGCVALENQELLKVSRFIRLQSTPIIVVDKMLMAPRSVIMQQERELRDFIESWRQTWESRNVDAYMSHYSPNFQSCWLDFKGWKEKKRKLSKRYGNIRVKLGNVYLYRQNGLITAIFMQGYSSDGFHSAGIKILYVTHAGKYQIYAEDYHQPVDDPFPVGTLLARAGLDPEPAAGEKNEFRIRLVSTDEPDQASQGETETPRPSAPSRGGVLVRMARAVTPDPGSVPLELNEKYIEDSSPQRMVTTRAMGNDSKHGEELFVAGALTQTARSRPIAALPREKKGGTTLASLSQPEHVPAAEEKKFEQGQFDRAASEGATLDTMTVDRKTVLVFLDKWKAAWEQKDLDRFMKMYHPDFEQGTANYKALLKSKRNFFRKYGTIRVQMDRVEIRKDMDKIVVEFIQSFQGDDYRDKGRKSMVLAGGKDKGLRILSEGWSPLQEYSSDTSSKTP